MDELLQNLQLCLDRVDDEIAYAQQKRDSKRTQLLWHLKATIIRGASEAIDVKYHDYEQVQAYTKGGH